MRRALPAARDRAPVRAGSVAGEKGAERRGRGIWYFFRARGGGGGASYGRGSAGMVRPPERSTTICVWRSTGLGRTRYPVSGLCSRGTGRFWSVRGYPTKGGTGTPPAREAGRPTLGRRPGERAERRRRPRARAGRLGGARRAEGEPRASARCKIGEAKPPRSAIWGRRARARDFEPARKRCTGSLALNRGSWEIGREWPRTLNNLGLLARERATIRRRGASTRRASRSIARSAIVVILRFRSTTWAAWPATRETSGRVRTYEESLAIRRELGDRRGIASSLTNLGDVAHEQGELRPTPARLVEEGLAIRRELGDRRGIAISLGILGSIAHNQGDLAAPRRRTTRRASGSAASWAIEGGSPPRSTISPTLRRKRTRRSKPGSSTRKASGSHASWVIGGASPSR